MHMQSGIFPLQPLWGLFSQHHVLWCFLASPSEGFAPPLDYRLCTESFACTYVLFTSTPLPCPSLTIFSPVSRYRSYSISSKAFCTYHLFTSPSRPATSTTTPIQNPIIGSLHVCGE